MLVVLFVLPVLLVAVVIIVSEYDPSSLIQGGAGFMFANAIGVSLVVIAVFLPLTVTIFNKSDVK